MKKKEIIVIIAVLLIALVLAFYPKIKDNSESSVTNSTNTTTNPKYVYIKLTGEVVNDSDLIKRPYGSTIGDMRDIIELYCNEYSIFPDSSKRLTKNETIIIKSIDTGSLDESIKEDTLDKININTASKDELMTLYGIGDKRSDYVLGYRSTKLFESFEELQKEIGVSDAILAKIKEQATL